jgi:hypothetical protein
MTMSSGWPALSYERWSETCDTLHAHTQVLGKLADVVTKYGAEEAIVVSITYAHEARRRSYELLAEAFGL